MCYYRSLVLFSIIAICFYKFAPVECDSSQNVTTDDLTTINYNGTNINESVIIDQLINETQHFLETTKIQLNDALVVEGRKKDKKDLMSRILPMLAIPFLISSALIPMMLTTLKMMLLKSMFVGKMGILLLALNAIWRVNNQGGVYSHNINVHAEQHELMHEHYGYNHGEEYGAYVNK